MKNNIGIGGRQRAAESVGIADIADLVIDSIGKLKLVKKCRLCFRRLTETGHFGTEREKPFAEPGTFKTGMPGNKNRSVSIEGCPIRNSLIIHKEHFFEKRGKCPRFSTELFLNPKAD